MEQNYISIEQKTNFTFTFFLQSPTKCRHEGRKKNVEKKNSMHQYWCPKAMN